MHYSLEHVTYPRVRELLKEVWRVLKPGGRFVIVTSDTYQQFRWLVDHPHGWDGKPFWERASELLFGSQDYPENSHKCYFDQRTLRQLLEEALFVVEKIENHNPRNTDLEVVAKRPHTPETYVETTFSFRVPKPQIGVQDPLGSGGIGYSHSQIIERPKINPFQETSVEEIGVIEKTPVFEKTPNPLPGLPRSVDAPADRPMVQVGQYWLELHQNDPWINPPLLAGTYESNETKLIREYAQKYPDHAILDIGAHVGYYTLVLADATKGARGMIVAFEASPDNFKLLEKNIRRNDLGGQVMVFNLAVADKPGTIGLSRNPYCTGDTRPWEAGFGPMTQVEAISLDDMIGRESKISVIKLDVQGGEVKALRGMKELIAAQKNLAVFVEFWPWGLQQAGNTIDEFIECFWKFSKVYEIWEDPPGLKEIRLSDLPTLVAPNTDHFTNLLFIK
jgi:FkbM family methyltransferase